MASLEGKLSLSQALIKVLAWPVSFVGGIFLARYANMLFDKIHFGSERDNIPGDKTVVSKLRRKP